MALSCSSLSLQTLCIFCPGVIDMYSDQWNITHVCVENDKPLSLEYSFPALVYTLSKEFFPGSL